MCYLLRGLNLTIVFDESGIIFHYDSNLKSVAYAQKNTHFDRYPISTKINW